jgi:hypothetical protein
MKNIQQRLLQAKINIAVKEYMNLMMLYHVESRRNFTGGGNTLYWLLSYKNNIMNALAASIKKERPT